MPADGGLYSDQIPLIKKIESDEGGWNEADTLWEPSRVEVIDKKL